MLLEKELSQLRTRGFERVEISHTKPGSAFFEEIQMPTRGDIASAGYDFYSCEDKRLEPGEQHLFWTNVKAYMNPDEVLYLYPRSGLGVKSGVILANTVGVIDSSYYGNKSNDGNIGIALKNTGVNPIVIETGERIAQGVFMNYLLADDDLTCSKVRTGGFGSTGC